jgi:KUP system potassium uptake protein
VELATSSSFTGDHPVQATAGDVYGVISLVPWSLTLMVLNKFVVFIMRADNEGKGGVMARVHSCDEPRSRQP